MENANLMFAALVHHLDHANRAVLKGLLLTRLHPRQDRYVIYVRVPPLVLGEQRHVRTDPLAGFQDRRRLVLNVPAYTGPR